MLLRRQFGGKVQNSKTCTPSNRSFRSWEGILRISLHPYTGRGRPAGKEVLWSPQLGDKQELPSSVRGLVGQMPWLPHSHPLGLPTHTSQSSRACGLSLPHLKPCPQQPSLGQLVYKHPFPQSANAEVPFLQGLSNSSGTFSG